VLSCILGTLPSVANVGESHWLREPELRQKPDPARFPCRTCGPTCETLEPLATHRGPEAGWWQRVACRYGTPAWLVSSDKRPLYFDRYGLPDVAMVLYRDPLYWCRSRHSRQGTPPAEAADVWSRLYLRVLAWLARHDIPWQGLNWSEARRPGATELAGAVDAAMGLHLPVGSTEAWQPGCYVGGTRSLQTGLQPEAPHGWTPAEAEAIQAATAHTMGALS